MANNSVSSQVSLISFGKPSYNDCHQKKLKTENEKIKKNRKKKLFPFFQDRKRRKVDTTIPIPTISYTDETNLPVYINENAIEKSNSFNSELISLASINNSEEIPNHVLSITTANFNNIKDIELNQKQNTQNIATGNIHHQIVDNENKKHENVFTKFFERFILSKNAAKKSNTMNVKNHSFFSLIFPALLMHPALLKMDNITSKDPLYMLTEKFKLKLAASHIDDAIYGRGTFGKARACRQPIYSQRCFQIISHRFWTWFLYVTIAVHSIIIIWEQPPTPLYLGEKWPVTIDAEGSAIVWGINPSIIALHALCLIIYFLDVSLHTVFMGSSNVWTSRENVNLRVECTFAIFFLIDFIILIIESILQMDSDWVPPTANIERLLPPFRALRVSMLLCKSKNVAHIFNVLRSIFRKLGKVIAIIVIFIVIFASIGLQIFMDIYHSIPADCCNSTTSWNCSSVYSGAFDNIGIASLHMFVLMSTENYPELIIPAIDISWGYFFFFGIFLYAGVFFLTAILLAIIVESYWEYSKKHVKAERKQERQELAKAWNLLDPTGTGSLSTDDPKLIQLFKELRPNNSETERQDLIGAISGYSDNTIDAFDWTTRLIETLLLEFEPAEPRHKTMSQTSDDGAWKTKIIRYWMRFRNFIRYIMHSRLVGISVLVLIVCHSILFTMMWYQINHTRTQLIIQSTRTIIIFLFTIEVMMRFIGDGNALLTILNLFDVAMVVIAIIADIIWYVIWFSYDSILDIPSIHLGWCVVAASLAVIGRLLVHSHMARTAVDIMQSIYPVMFDLTLLVFAIIYCYAVIGFELFQDKTTDSSEALGYEGSYIAYGCGVGFESVGCSLIIVFQIITTNDWHEIMLGAMIDAGSPSVIYFLSCYLMVDMVVMNLFVAISIEAYKKLARDMRNTVVAADAVDEINENSVSETEKKDLVNRAKQGASAAKSMLSEIFTPTKHNHNTGNMTMVGASPYQGRRGTRGSLTVLGSKTSTPAIRRRSVLTESSSDDSGDESKKIKKTPETPRNRRSSMTVTSVMSIKPTLPTVEDEPENELVPPQNLEQRRKSTLVARMAKRKQKKKDENEKAEKETFDQIRFNVADIIHLHKRVRITTSYVAKSTTEMSVNDGQILIVTAKCGNMYQGPDGFFPAMIAEDNPSSDDIVTNSPLTTRRVNFSNNSNSPSDTFQSGGSVIFTNPGLVHRHSNARMVKNTASVEWRRKILGDMTVMNRDELQELSKQFKSGLGRHHRVGALDPTTSRPSVPIMEIEHIIEEEENKGVVRFTEPEQFESVSKVTENKAKKMEGSKDTLTIPESSPTAPRQKSKEVPQWAKNFAKAKNLSLATSSTKIEDKVSPIPTTSDDDESGLKFAFSLTNNNPKPAAKSRSPAQSKPPSHTRTGIRRTVPSPKVNRSPNTRSPKTQPRKRTS